MAREHRRSLARLRALHLTLVATSMWPMGLTTPSGKSPQAVWYRPLQVQALIFRLTELELVPLLGHL